MNEPSDRKVPVGMFVGIALLSASLLAFQVLLTRVCALRLAFHFSFLIISNSLLGIGASGTVLTLLETRWRKRPEAWIFGASVLENVRVVGSSAERRTLVASEPVQEAIARAEGRLGPFGRVFVRPSGTEPLVRVMGEGEDEGAVRAAVKEVVAALEAQWAKQAPGLSSGASSAEER